MGNCFSGQKESSSDSKKDNKASTTKAATTETKTNAASTSTAVAETKTTTTTKTEQPATIEVVVADPVEKQQKPVVAEEKPVVAKVEKPVVAEATSTSGASAPSNLDTATNSFILKPANIAKFLIGPKGSTIKQLQEETSSKINVKDIDDETKHIFIEGSSDPAACYARIMSELKKYGWEYDQKENQFVEHDTEAMKMFKQLEKKISEESKLMSECFEKAKQSHESGDGAAAKQLSEEGKKHQELMKQYQQESAQTMFDHLNKEKGDLEIDLHGQYVENAMNFLKERIEKLRKANQPKLTIIYGAGNHSDEKGPKIKPAVLEYLKKEEITFEEINHGSISANI